MVRGATIGFVVIMLLTAVATWLMFTGAVYAQQAPQHVFSGSVLNAGNTVYAGHVSFLDMSGHEVATGNVNNDGRYKIAVREAAGRNYSGQTFQITVSFQNRIYERAQRVNWQAGGVTTLDLEFGTGSGWRWHQAPPQAPPQNDQRQIEEDQRRMEQNDEDRDRRIEMDEQRMQRENDDSARRMEMEEQRMEMEQQRMESEDALRREQMTLQSERENKDREERREMEQQQRQQQMEQQTAREDRETKERMEMEKQRMEREDVDRKERMEMERQRMAMDQQRMGSGQPGVQPVAGERPKSGPGRGLFSNSKAGEATSGIDNIMDPGMLTIIGIALTVLTTGMTLFKGD
jgi:hypothetical protein